MMGPAAFAVIVVNPEASPVPKAAPRDPLAWAVWGERQRTTSCRAPSTISRAATTSSTTSTTLGL